MYHLTGPSGQTLDIEWNGDSATLQIDRTTTSIDLVAESTTKCHILHQNKSYSTEILDFNFETKLAKVKVNGNVYAISIKDRFDDLLKSLGMEDAGTKKIKDIKAPMPGLVLSVAVAAGDTVAKDSAVLILEAMKMENVIKSPADGVVKKVHAIQGKAVEKNAVLIEFE
jgi:biotin carboxyl carrier protein